MSGEAEQQRFVPGVKPGENGLIAKLAGVNTGGMIAVPKTNMDFSPKPTLDAMRAAVATLVSSNNYRIIPPQNVHVSHYDPSIQNIMKLYTEFDVNPVAGDRLVDACLIYAQESTEVLSQIELILGSLGFREQDDKLAKSVALWYTVIVKNLTIHDEASYSRQNSSAPYPTSYLAVHQFTTNATAAVLYEVCFPSTKVGKSSSKAKGAKKTIMDRLYTDGGLLRPMAGKRAKKVARTLRVMTEMMPTFRCRVYEILTADPMNFLSNQRAKCKNGIWDPTKFNDDVPSSVRHSGLTLWMAVLLDQLDPDFAGALKKAVNLKSFKGCFLFEDSREKLLGKKSGMIRNMKTDQEALNDGGAWSGQEAPQMQHWCGESLFGVKRSVAGKFMDTATINNDIRSDEKVETFTHGVWDRVEDPDPDEFSRNDIDRELKEEMSLQWNKHRIAGGKLDAVSKAIRDALPGWQRIGSDAVMGEGVVVTWDHLRSQLMDFLRDLGFDGRYYIAELLLVYLVSNELMTRYAEKLAADVSSDDSGDFESRRGEFRLGSAATVIVRAVIGMNGKMQSPLQVYKILKQNGNASAMSNFGKMMAVLTALDCLLPGSEEKIIIRDTKTFLSTQWKKWSETVWEPGADDLTDDDIYGGIAAPVLWFVDSLSEGAKIRFVEVKRCKWKTSERFYRGFIADESSQIWRIGHVTAKGGLPLYREVETQSEKKRREDEEKAAQEREEEARRCAKKNKEEELSRLQDKHKQQQETLKNHKKKLRDIESGKIDNPGKVGLDNLKGAIDKENDNAKKLLNEISNLKQELGISDSDLSEEDDNSDDDEEDDQTDKEAKEKQKAMEELKKLEAQYNAKQELLEKKKRRWEAIKDSATEPIERTEKEPDGAKKTKIHNVPVTPESRNALQIEIKSGTEDLKKMQELIEKERRARGISETSNPRALTYPAPTGNTGAV